jgi:hypothetical protein
MWARRIGVFALLVASFGCNFLNSRTSTPGGSPATSPPPTSPSPQAQVPSQDSAGIFDGLGNFDANAYVNMAAKYGTSAMISERFGSSWSDYHSTDISAHTWWQAPEISYTDAVRSQQQFIYSLGKPCVTDDFSSSYAQVAYVTDSTVSTSTPGVDGISTIQRDHCLWAGLPQRYWASGVGHPTANLMRNTVQSLDPYGMPSQPVDVTRAYGAGEAAGCSYMVFQSGQVACGEGGNTTHTTFYFKPFPPNFTPTAASVTNNGEFLLVTGWNTETYDGQLAVIAIGSSKPAGQFWGYEWNEIYPGFRNYSLPVFAKLLGIIDLPGMQAPTAVEAVGNWVYTPGTFLPVPAGQSRDTGQPGKFPLETQSNWQCFVDGDCAKLYDTAGFALVASRFERKVILLDLGPLFQTIQKGMFTSWSQFRANVANTGQNPGQWPLTFFEDPGSKPVVVKTISYDQKVTAISASLYTDNRALIATEDGHIHIWDVDGLQTGSGTGSNAKEIKNVSGMGFNITRIAHMKHWISTTNGGNVRWQYIVLSRGDKTIRWLDLSGAQPTVVRTFQDSRLKDPITVEDNNNHGTQTDLINIADRGDNTVKAYRYGPVIMKTTPGTPTFGMGSKGNDPFEYEGAYSMPTAPFAISIENVP